MIRIADFYTETCGPCLQLKSILERIEADNEDVVLENIDCHASQKNIDIAMAYGIKSVPVLIISNESGHHVRLDGFKSASEITEVIDSLAEYDRLQGRK